MTAGLQLLAAYLLGAIPFAYLAGKLLQGIDIRQHGSGNVGATNVLRVLGKGPGAAVLLLDMGKGLVAAAVLPRLTGVMANPCTGQGVLDATWWPCLLGLAAVLGHSYTVFLGFKGGKGVATAAGVFLGLAPQAMALVIATFVVAFIATKMVSFGSLAGAAVLPLLVYLADENIPAASRTLVMNCTGDDWSFHARPVFWLALVVASLVWWKHIPNIKRILAGTEPKFGNKG